MKKIILRLVLVILLGSFFISPTQAQNQDMTDVEKRLNEIESCQATSHDEINKITDKLNNQIRQSEKESDLKIKDMELKFRENGLQFEENYNHFRFIIWIFGGGSILLLFFSVIRLFKNFSDLLNKRIPEIAEQKASEYFDKHFEKSFKKFVQLIETYDRELRIKKNKSILVLSKEDSDLGFIKKFFANMDFKKVEYINFDPNMNYSSRDLILFNDEEDKFQKNEITDFAKKVPKSTICFYFGKERMPVSELGDNFTYGNVRMQLYGNIMNALNYQDLL